MPYEFASSDHPIQDKDTEESPWDDTPSSSSSTTTAHAEAEWTRLSSDFQTAGYRDGITAGKESALQEGFDAGFAQAGAPCGHELGLLRGLSSALLLHLSRTQIQTQTQTQVQTEEQDQQKMTSASAAIRDIIDALAIVQFADIAPPPPPEEAEHLHSHGVGAGAGVNDEEKGENGMEEEEKERGSSVELGPSARSTRKTTTIEDVRALRLKLETLLRETGLKVDL